MRREVTARVDGKDWALGGVTITDAKNPQWAAEERVLFGRIALELCLPRAQRYWAHLMEEQAIYLLTLKAVCSALVDGLRDEELEREVSTAFMRHRRVPHAGQPVARGRERDREGASQC